MKQGFTYDDVLLVPQYSEVNPGEVDTGVQLAKGIKLEIPIISAAMDMVTESEMAIELAKLGGMGVIHRSNTVSEQVEMVRRVKKLKSPLTRSKDSLDFLNPSPTPFGRGRGELRRVGLVVAAACGPHDLARAEALDKAGADCIVIDCAHAHKKSVIERARKIKKEIKADLMVGNIATAKAAQELVKVADIIKVGVGPGAICTTRVVAGVGVPQLTAVMEVARIARAKKIPVIADGGLRYSGDIVKALAAGAQAVMLGSMLAGTDEAPGQIIKINDKEFKVYRGMGSEAVMNKRKSSDRYFQEQSKKFVPEGVEGMIDYKGKLADVIFQIVGGLKAGMGYAGARNLKELFKKAEFIQISGAGYRESHPHTVMINKKAPNY